MKNMIKFSKIIFFGIAVLLTSCEEQLQEKPDSPSLYTFYSNAKQIQLGVNSIYDELGNTTLGEFPHFYNRFVFECITGLQIGWEKGPLRYNLGNVSTSDEYINPYWTQCYRAINRANLMIEATSKVSDPNNADLLKRLVAESYFLRAFYYLELVKYFDNVPLKITATGDKYDDYPSNAGGKAKVLEQIYADCNIAFNGLPDSYTGADIGRANKWAAKTLLMKAQLWGEKWLDAKATAEVIINTSGISLFQDFSHNFDIEHENIGERIFEAQVNGVANSGEYTQWSGHFNPEDYPSDLNGSGWSWLSATKEFRESYDSNDKRIAGTFIERYQTGRFGLVDGQFPWVTWSANANYGVSRFEGLVNTSANPRDPSQMIFGKAWCAKLTELGTAVWSDTQKNTVYMRYADVLMGHSEACNESGAGDPYMGINEVRQRAGLTNLSGLSKDGLRDAIVAERLHEFFWEQELYPELRRKSVFGGSPDYLGDQIKTYARISKNAREPKARDYVMPIPLKEIQGNPNVTQNDVWK